MAAEYPISRDLADTFADAVGLFDVWTPAVPEREVSINRQSFTMSAVCDLVSGFDHEVPEHILSLLFS